MPTVIIAGVGSISYEEKIPGSPRYMFANGQARVERTFTCAWIDRVSLVQYLLGYPRIVNVTPTYSYISRIRPDAITDFTNPLKTLDDPDAFWLYASSIVTMTGKSELGTYDQFGVAEYQEAEFTLAYEPRTYKVLSDSEMPPANSLDATTGQSYGLCDEATLARYVTRNHRPSAEFVTLPRGTMTWVDVPIGVAALVKVDFASARLLPSTEITYTWHEVPFLPDALTSSPYVDPVSNQTKIIPSFVGCLNRYPFFDGSIDPVTGTTRDPYNPGTLLLLAAEVKPYRTAAGVFVNDITYRMKYFEPLPNRGHNFFLRYLRNTDQLVREKITKNGTNDLLAIPAGDGSNPDEAYTNNIAAGTSKSIYPYAGFSSLFRFKVGSKDGVVGN